MVREARNFDLVAEEGVNAQHGWFLVSTMSPKTPMGSSERLPKQIWIRHIDAIAFSTLVMFNTVNGHDFSATPGCISHQTPGGSSLGVVVWG